MFSLNASPPDSPLPFREGKQVLTARCIEAEETMVSRRSVPRACSRRRGTNYNCNAKPLLRLTADATALHASVNAMAANGNTILLEGLMWGWRTISPNAPFADAKPYKTADNEKIIILLTDGMNAWSSANNHNKSVYSSFGYYGAGRLTDPGSANPTTSAAARAQMEAKTLSACGNAKAEMHLLAADGLCGKRFIDHRHGVR